MYQKITAWFEPRLTSRSQQLDSDFILFFRWKNRINLMGHEYEGCVDFRISHEKHTFRRIVDACGRPVQLQVVDTLVNLTD
jgi:hypothetical protein